MGEPARRLGAQNAHLRSGRTIRKQGTMLLPSARDAASAPIYAHAAAMLSLSDAERVAARFGLGRDAVISGPVARGELGQVWRIDTSAGAVGGEGTVRGTVAGRRRGRCPIPGGRACGRRADAGDRADRRRRRRRRRRVGGRPRLRMGRPEPLDRRLDPAAVGQLVASIHRVSTYGRSPVHWWYTEAVGGVRWDELVTELVAVGAPFAPTLATQRDELVAVEALLEAPSNLQTCHRDLFADNILRTAAGGLCVIDWENSGLADPTQELAVVLLEFACGDVARARQLYRAYMDADGPGRLERPGQFSMAIAQLGHLGERACRLWLDPTQDRARSTARVEEFLGEPITRQLIDRLLDATAP